MLLDAPIRSNTARLELRDRVWRDVQLEFRTERLVPDFYERLLGTEARRFVKVFQTVEAWKLTADFGPTVLFADHVSGGLADKCCLRDLAVELGVEPSLVWASQVPMQESTGIFAALEQHGRRLIASDAATRTYTDPLGESAEMVIARMGLREAVRLHQGTETSG